MLGLGSWRMGLIGKEEAVRGVWLLVGGWSVGGVTRWERLDFEGGSGHGVEVGDWAV